MSKRDNVDTLGVQRSDALEADHATLKIGQFTDSFPPIINGVSTSISGHHAELLQQGQDAHVFTFGYRNQAQSNIPNVWRTPGIPLGISPFRYNVILSQEASRVAASLDILHVHDPLSIANIALRIARRTNRPLIFTNHTRQDIYLQNFPRLMRPFLSRYVYAQIARLMRFCEITTAPARSTIDWMRSMVPDAADRLRVVHNGIPLDDFDRIDNPVTRASFGIPDDQTLFMYVGRISPEKNLKAFAAALIDAVNGGAQAHWLLIGDGLSRAGLEAQVAPIRERVHFLGQVPHEQLPPYLPMIDVFATTSLSEVNPLSVVEAMACGKPFVGLRAAWWEEYPDYQQAGVLTAHNQQDLSEAIRRLCQDKAARAQMGACAKQISYRFDSRHITAQWIEIYRSTCEAYRAGNRKR
jgi:glycosyltransferase involved in cell wall biosynthesis